jgi:cytochrome oxidase assembly protein ShyY1
VGVGCAALIVIAALAFWLFRRRQAKKNLAANPSYQSVHPEASELGGSSQAAPSQTAPSSTMANTTASELEGTNGPKPIHELYA